MRAVRAVECARRITRSPSAAFSSGRPKCFLCAIAISIFAARGSAQDLPITVHNTAHGLTHDVLTRVIQDSRGFLWVGGAAELARFDGERFTSYGRAEGLDVGTSVNQVFPGPDGDLWIATNGAGIFRFNVTTPETAARMTRIRIGEGRPSNRVNTILVAADGRIWAGTDAGLFTGIPPQGLHRVTLPLPARVAQDTLHVVSLVAKDSGVWVGTPAGVYRCGVEPAGCRVVSPRGVRSLTFGPDGRLWLVRGDGTELWPLNGDENAGPAEVIGKHWNPRRVVTASDGMLVITEDRRVIWTDGHAERILYASAEAPRLNDILEDAAGNLWVATNGAGLLGIRRQGVTLFSQHRQLRAPYLRTFAGQARARPYVLSQDDWIHRIEGSMVTSARVVRPPHIGRSLWSDTAVRLDSSGDVWLGTGAGLLHFAKPAFAAAAPPEAGPSRIYTVADGLAANHIAEIFEDANGDLWIANVPAGAETLTVWRRRSSRFEKLGAAYGLPPSSQLGGFVQDTHGTMWARLREGGLVRLRADRATVFGVEHGLPPLITALSADRDGGLWVGGSDSVLKVKDASQEIQVIPFLTRIGATVVSLAQPQSGVLFVGTFAGLIRLSLDDKSTHRFSSFEGLPRGGVEALLAEPDGSLLLIAGRTLARLTPLQARSHLPPRCLLTAVRVGGRPVPMPESGLERVAGLTIQPSQNHVDLQLLGLSPRLGEPLEYEYRLADVSQSWTRAPERRVTFAGLAAGRYTLEARVSGANGTSVSPVATIAFRVLPPWYRRWWFLTLAGTTALLAAFLAHRSRLARVLRTERLRARIATDLHDDIGSSLSQIAILAEVARRRAASSEPAIAEPLTSIANTSRDLVDAMSDIVWAVNPRTDSLADLTRRMHRFAEETLGGANIALTFCAPRDVDLKLGADLRRELYLILKESVNNIARHSGASEAVVDLALVRSELRLVISDNGRGFDPARPADGNGIDSMRKRAAAFGGVFNIDSTPGRGTRVMLTANLRRVSK